MSWPKYGSFDRSIAIDLDVTIAVVVVVVVDKAATDGETESDAGDAGS